MKKLIALVSILFSLQSSAGILIEPQLGYVFVHKLETTATLTLPSGASGTQALNSSGKALEIGGRLGLQYFGLMGGLNYSKGLSNKGTNVGAFLGYAAPILFRVWGGYNFSAKVNYTTTYTSGNSKEFGIGFTGLPFLSMNLIYRKYDLTSLTQNNVTYTASGVTPSELMFAFSFPFNI